jgi:predicted DsbA family dithiol-disulfide isomerase
MASETELIVSVWSDYVCPFCYLEEPILQRLKDEEGDRIAIEWRAFELRPEPVPTLDPDGDYLHDIWGRAVYPMARERNMTLRLPPVQPRSRKALEAAEFARDQGRFDDLHRALFIAFFEDGRDIGSLDVLLEIGAETGLDTAALRQALDQGRFTDRVIEDEDLARRLGIQGVPMILVRRSGQALEQGRGLSGAQPYQTLRSALALF